MKDEFLTEDEQLRRNLQATIEAHAGERKELEARHGPVWSTAEATRDFTFRAFAAPVAFVTRKADGRKGTLIFQARPRFYFCFEPEED